MIRVNVRYGCGYGTHTAELEFDDTATEEEIEEDVGDFARERFDWSWSRMDEDDE